MIEQIAKECVNDCKGFSTVVKCQKKANVKNEIVEIGNHEAQILREIN